ncbi:MAG TPA: hypothetical protein VGN57_18955 [Pirellulaceae bacterium]|jgi:hypothetical protein|nr:hypothetical protein [Pirellulaceae bacterium]
MANLHPQNGIFRIFEIEIRAPGGEWKRIRGDEVMNSVLDPGVIYELRVLNPEITFGLGIGGEPVMVPEGPALPLHD